MRLLLEDCERILGNLHEALLREAGAPVFRFGVTNEGSRPGKNTLVVISTKGNFKICPPQLGDDEHSKERRTLDRLLPKPPKPPKGQLMTILDYLAPDRLDFLHHVPRSFDLDMPPNLSRDSDAFYYKPDRPQTPVKSFRLECEQWRHGIAEECFDGEIFVDSDQDEIQGALQCEIHAENLSAPTKRIIRVKIVVVRESTKDYASNLVTNLSNLDS